MNPPTESRTPPFGRLAAAGLLAILAACDIIPPPQDDATRYYVLSGGGAAPAASPAQGAARVGLKAVRLEGYLRRREMVVRTGANEVAFKDYRRWAEPLDSAIARELKAGLLSSPSVAQVYVEPFLSGQERDYDVSVEITRFEGDALAGRFAASLAAVVEVSTVGDSPHVVARKVFVAPAAAWDGSNYDQLASLLSRDVAALAGEIVAQLPPRG
jgi:hypothetical protein